MSLVPKGGNDRVNTPQWLADAIIDYFDPKGTLCEPCAGSGNFLRACMFHDYYEIDKGWDFFTCENHYDWIITNPPFSLFRKFLNKSMECADNVVFLCPINHFWLKARLRDMEEHGFWFKDILLVDTPKEFPQSGFQWGAVYIGRQHDTG